MIISFARALGGGLAGAASPRSSVAWSPPGDSLPQRQLLDLRCGHSPHQLAGRLLITHWTGLLGRGMVDAPPTAWTDLLGRPMDDLPETPNHPRAPTLGALDEQWDTLDEAAQRLGTTVQGVRSRIKRGSLEKILWNDGRLRVRLSADS